MSFIILPHTIFYHNQSIYNILSSIRYGTIYPSPIKGVGTTGISCIPFMSYVHLFLIKPAMSVSYCVWYQTPPMGYGTASVTTLWTSLITFFHNKKRGQVVDKSNPSSAIPGMIYGR